MITGLGYAVLRVGDLARSVGFYRDILGLAEAHTLRRPDGRVAAVFLRAPDGTMLKLFGDGEGEPEEDALRVGLKHLCFLVDDAYHTLTELEARGLPIEGEPKLDAAGGYLYALTDPDGNRVELLELPEDAALRADTPGGGA